MAKPSFSFYREHSPGEWEGPASGHTGSNGPVPAAAPAGRRRGSRAVVGAGGASEAAQPVVSALTGQRHPWGRELPKAPAPKVLIQ